MMQRKPKKPRFRRVLLKLSGEALIGEQGFGVDPRMRPGSPRKSRKFMPSVSTVAATSAW